MKILLVISLAFVSISAACRPVTGLDEVIRALQKGDANELSKYVDNNIEITLPGKTDNYSHAQAVIIIQDFFNNNGIKGFEIKHKGDNGGNEFCIGILTTRSGNYRTTVFMANKNGKQVIREIRFQST